MAGSLTLFPGSRRLGFARRHAASTAAYSPEGRRRSIDSALQRQAEAFRRLGADPADIADHIAELGIAIDALLPLGRRRAP